ncbi:MAG: peptidoglycan DD-metalloendopeptidase family protein [Clostridiales Family XIII bacterium]|jgi:murein DD-endopeptidase MepM/ murein hydrolase activator NlpD|nr:peptidoglycan DD-metalloendopeptidase family protein [Clostridiales Family XIII bacterium]
MKLPIHLKNTIAMMSVVLFVCIALASLGGGKLRVVLERAARTLLPARLLLFWEKRHEIAVRDRARHIALGGFAAVNLFGMELQRISLILFHRGRHMKRSTAAGLSALGGTAVAVCLIAVMVIGSQVVSVSVNGKVIGYVKNEAQYASLVQNAKEKISERNGNTEITIQDSEVALSASFVPSAKEADTVDEDALITTLIEGGAVTATVYTLTVGDEALATVATLKEASDVLNSISGQFGGDKETVNGQFLDDVTINSASLDIDSVKLDEPAKVVDYLLTGSADGESAAPLVHYQTVGMEMTNEPIEFTVTEEKTSTLYIGETEIKTEGVNGEQRIARAVTRVNGEVTESIEVESVMLVEPQEEVVLVGTKPIPSYVGPSSNSGGGGSGVLGRPLDSWSLSRGVSSSHYGDDMLADAGSPIYAAESGTVTCAGWAGGYGNLVIVDHGNGLVTYYAHCNTMNVAEGDYVTRGQQIATVGRTGSATANHLHFEVRLNGVIQEPMGYL